MAAENSFDPPDWQDRKHYPATDAAITVWAWEFLRRNHAYRKFYKEKVEPYIERLTFAHIPGETFIVGRNAAGDLWPHLDEMINVFGVDIPTDPAEPKAPGFVFRATGISYSTGQNAGFSLAKTEIAYVFDLERPLEPQFKAIKQHANKMQEKSEYYLKDARRRPQKYVIYLKILDALEAGEKPSIIAQHLYPQSSYDDGHSDRKSFADDRKAAERMRDGGYKKIIASK